MIETDIKTQPTVATSELICMTATLCIMNSVISGTRGCLKRISLRLKGFAVLNTSLDSFTQITKTDFPPPVLFCYQTQL